MIYLDHNAITPMRPEAIAAVRAALDVFGNPSSVHAAGRAARDLLDHARGQVAAAIGAARADVVFTSGATESAAIALRGALARAPAGRNRLVVTAVEHPCVLSLGRALEKSGTPLTVVPVDRRGLLDPERFRAALGPDVAPRLRDAREQRDRRPPARARARRRGARGRRALLLRRRPGGREDPARRPHPRRGPRRADRPEVRRSAGRGRALDHARPAARAARGGRAGARPPSRHREPARHRRAGSRDRGGLRAARRRVRARRGAPRSAGGGAPRRGTGRPRERRGRAAPAGHRLRDVRGLRRRGAPHGDGRGRRLRERGVGLPLRLDDALGRAARARALRRGGAEHDPLLARLDDHRRGRGGRAADRPSRSWSGCGARSRPDAAVSARSRTPGRGRCEYVEARRPWAATRVPHSTPKSPRTTAAIARSVPTAPS